MEHDKATISVIMSVYNTKLQYLNIAVQSILQQTYPYFEFIIIDDGCDEECARFLQSIGDKRVILIRNPENYGLTKSLNIGLQRARGKYIVRMDADDRSYPQRLEKQYDYMEQHPEIAILGCWVKEGSRVNKCCGSVSTKWRYARMLFDNVGIYHPSAFIRTDFLKENHLAYDETFKKAQDFELWSRSLLKGYMYVFPQVLLEYRIHDGQISCYGSKEQEKFNILTRRNMLKLLEVQLDPDEERQFAHMNTSCMSPESVIGLFDKILHANQEKKFFEQRFLRYELETKWIRFLLQAAGTEKRKWLRGRYARTLLWPGYYVYMLYIAWCKQDFLHHNRESVK